MINLSMDEKLKSGEALDVSPYRHGEHFKLPAGFFVEGKDYCDAKSEAWIWSIGRDLKTDVVLASTTCEFYQNPHYECLWLR